MSATGTSSAGAEAGASEDLQVAGWQWGPGTVQAVVRLWPHCSRLAVPAAQQCLILSQSVSSC